MLVLVLLKFFVVLLLGLSVEPKCSRLPSGNCWVNCMQEIYDVICTNVTAQQVQSDISVFQSSSTQIRLYLWLSSGINRLSGDVFASIATHIVAIDMQDLDNLDTFPELYALTNLKRLNIWNSPNLTDFTMELLPSSLEKLSLNKMSFEVLEDDLFDKTRFPHLENFVLRNLTIRGWRKDFLSTFPTLKTFQISNCTIVLPPSMDDVFPVATSIKNFTFSSNVFVGDGKHIEPSAFFAITLSALQPDGGFIDLSDNNITFREDALQAIQKLSTAVGLDLSGNSINVSDPAFLAEFFKDFRNLKHLDLGDTGLHATRGLFRNLPSLETLILDKNSFGGNAFTSEDIYDGCLADNLTGLVVSDNRFQRLPMGDDFSYIIGSIQDLSLRNNTFVIFEQDRSDFLRVAAYTASFLGLRKLDLSLNGLKSFNGRLLATSPALRVLDISCNNFTRITKSFFDGLPRTLEEIDLSMCIHTPKPAPMVDLDAFTTLPPIKVLTMNSASLKRGIFTALNASAAALESLEKLYLEDNQITYLSESNMPRLPHLKLLSLRRNALQSVQPHTFGNLKNLQHLILAENRISSVGFDNFGGQKVSLQQLEVLNLERNGLSHIDRGAFDSLSSLRSLMLGYNPTEVQDLFNDGGSELVYFGMQGYNRSCLRPAFLNTLSKLKWILPDSYNLLVINPDAGLRKRDDYLISIMNICLIGQVILDPEEYPGFQTFVSSTIHDTSNGYGNDQYPVIAAFSPLTYCPECPALQTLDTFTCAPKSSSSNEIRLTDLKQ